jgi:membrane-associated phospholipid phosphatase
MSDFSKSYWHYGSDATLFVEIGIPFIWALTDVKHRVRALYYVLVLGAINAINAWMKIVYQEPRPFWIPTSEYESFGATVPEQGKVIAIGCSTEYGNPSAHSMVGATIFLMFYLDLEDIPYKGRFSLRRLSVFIAFSIISLTVAYSRVLCGVHSIDQVIFGYTLGLYCAFVFHWTLRKPLKETIKKALY